MKSALTIAGVRFRLSGGAHCGGFPPAFLPFLGDAAAADLDCDVVCVGPDETLSSRPPAPDKPWSFTVTDVPEINTTSSKVDRDLRARSDAARRSASTSGCLDYCENLNNRGICDVVRRDQGGESLWRITGPLSFEQATVTWHPDRFAEFYGTYEQAWGKGLGLSLLVLRLRARGGLVLHGVAADLDGRGIACVGISGAGKSTLARLLDGAGAKVLTDERPVFRQWPPPAPGGESSSSFRVYGSPWPSSAGFARNEWAPLRRLYFLEHGETDRITPLTAKEAVSRLIHVATIPWQDPALLDPCLTTVESLLRDVPCAVLAFRPTPAVVDVIRADL